MSYYITGDCHARFEKILWFDRFNHELTGEDVMILLGDVGLNYFLNKTDQNSKNMLNDLPNEFFCIHGNHEARPSESIGYEEKEWHGGIVYYEPEYPNLLFAKDGEIYDFDGKKAVAIGGAYSVDKEIRLSMELPWFPDEQPSDEIKRRVEKKLQEVNWKVDYVFSHTCPSVYEPTDLFLEHIDQSKVDKSTEIWLNDIAQNLHYQRWYFGHYHDNREYTDATMLYEEIQELGKEGFVQKIGRPKYKKGEEVLFYVNVDGEYHECLGRIVTIDALGTFEQARETSYDIEGADFKDPSEMVFYKHVVESNLRKK